jgi:hypothetical protein
MARLLSGILGEARNKVGNVVASSWRGINYVRAYTIPNNPNTAAQQEWRTNWAKMVRCIACFKEPITHKFWEPLARGMSGFNMQIQKTVCPWKPGKELKKSVMAIGGLEPGNIGDLTYDANDGTVVFSWDKTCLGNGDPNDKAVLIVYDSANNVGWVSDGVYKRGDETGTFTVGPYRDANALVGWVFFYRGSQPPYLCSNSQGANFVPA